MLIENKFNKELKIKIYNSISCFCLVKYTMIVDYYIEKRFEKNYNKKKNKA